MEAGSRSHCCSAKENRHYIFWVCSCSLRYLSCKAHALYYIVICGLVWFYHIIEHYLINVTILVGGGSTEHKTFLILRRIQRDIIKNVNTCSCKVPVILVRF